MQVFRINFVGNISSGEDLDILRNLAWEDGSVACTRHTWVWAAYCQLKSRGRDVSFSYGLDPQAVNIVHGQIARRHLRAVDFKHNFVIGIRADYRPFPYGEFEIVQNQLSAGGRRVYIPLYSQPGLIPRSPLRNGVQNVCFAGRAVNFIDTTELSRKLEEIGCRYILKGEGEWHDMSDVDLLLGMRSFSKESYTNKPATKLYNAWLAGIPFIGGYDSAYEQVGSPGKDYFKVCAFDELIETITRLKNDPELYRQVVDAGRIAGQSYTPQKITDQWVSFLGEQVYPAFAAWRQHPGRSPWTRASRRIAFTLREEFTAGLRSKKK